MNDIKSLLKSSRDMQKPLLFVGGTGSGKTTTTLSWAHDNYDESNIFTYRGHSSTESIDLLGADTRMGSEIVFKDGILSQAFSKAVDSRVFFMIDELGRIPNRERKLIVNAMTPDDRGMLSLYTGRVIESNGRYSGETITVHKSNIMFVGTTNDGSEFDANTLSGSDTDKILSVYLDEITVKELKESISVFTKNLNINDSSTVIKYIELSKTVEGYIDNIIMTNDMLYRSLNYRHVKMMVVGIEKGLNMKLILKNILNSIFKPNMTNEQEKLKSIILSTVLEDDKVTIDKTKKSIDDAIERM